MCLPPITLMQELLDSIEQQVKAVIQVNPQLGIDEMPSDRAFANALHDRTFERSGYVVRMYTEFPPEVVRVPHREAARVFLNRFAQRMPRLRPDQFNDLYEPGDDRNVFRLFEGMLLLKFDR